MHMFHGLYSFSPLLELNMHFFFELLNMHFMVSTNLDIVSRKKDYTTKLVLLSILFPCRKENTTTVQIPWRE